MWSISMVILHIYFLIHFQISEILIQIIKIISAIGAFLFSKFPLIFWYKR